MKKFIQTSMLCLIASLAYSQSWTSVSGGTSNHVRVMQAFNGELFVGGDFASAGGISVNRMARWNGASWQPADSGLVGIPADMIVYNNELYFYGGAIKKLDGLNWVSPGVGSASGLGYAMEVYNNELYVSGGPYIFKFNGTNWTRDSVGFIYGSVYAMCVYRNELIVGGTFTTIDGIPFSNIAKWNGSSWSAIGLGVLNGNVDAVCSFNGELYVAGNFSSSQGNAGSGIMKWDGISWSAINPQITGISELDSIDNKLYAGGDPYYAGSSGIVVYDGNNWSGLGTGMNNWVMAIEKYNNEIYAGGRFTIAGGNLALYIAKWNESCLSLSISNQTNVSCFNGSDGSTTISATAGIPPYNFLWSNGQTIAAASGLSAGTYSVTVTDSVGCVDSISVVVSQPLQLNIYATIINATCDTCTNGSATVHLTNGFAPFVYTWNTSPLQTTQTATGLPSGTYTVCVSDANGCTACTSVFVDSTNCTGFSVAAQATTASCSVCADGSAWVTPTSGAAPYSYTWFTNPIQSNDTATGLLPGTYVVCAVDANGCTSCDTVTVTTGNCSAYFDLYPDTVPHQYSAVNRSSGSTSLTTVWSWGDGTTDTAAFPSHTYAAAGLYTICLSITDSVGCTDTYCNPYYLLKTENAMVTVNVVDALPTAIVQLAADDASFHIYPNPADEILMIDFPAEVAQAEIKLYDVAGALQQFMLTTGKQTTFSLDKLAAGIYFLEIRAGNSISRKKFIRQ